MAAGIAVLSAWVGLGSTGFVEDGGEFLPLGVPAGDQTSPAVAINAEGGYVVWQENSGAAGTYTIRARRLNRALTGWYRSFVVNSAVEGSHEEPQVVQLSDGGAAFFWRGGPLGKQGIYGRFLRPGGGNTANFLGDDLEIGAAGGGQNQNISATALKDGSVLVTWANYGDDGSGFGVFAQRLSATGEKVGGKFQVNSTTASNQRSPSVTAMPDGGFTIAWVSEGQRSNPTRDILCDVYARVFGPSAKATTGEMRLNQGLNLAATPSVTATADGGFVAAWAERDHNVTANGWDIMAGSFNREGVASKPNVRLNTYLKSDQLAPRLAAVNGSVMATWSSMGQDGSREGVFARSFSPTLELLDDEFGVNQTTISQQKDPVIAADSTGRVLSVWTSFNSLESGFDLVARKFAAPASIAKLSCDIVKTTDGVKLSWATEPGRTYQVQRSSDASNWDGADRSDRLAGGASDSVVYPLTTASGTFFRVVRLP